MNKRGHRSSLINFFMKNSRGQGLSISSIILIILGVIVLVILALGFFIGWQNIVPFVSQDNANTVSTQCLAACTAGTVYDFCSKNIQLTVGGNRYNQTCYDYSTNVTFSKYGIQPCPPLASSCPQTSP